MVSKNFTRREFLKTSAAAGTVFLTSPEKILGITNSKTRVILIRDDNVLDKSSKVNSDVLLKMLDDAVKALLDVDNPIKGWKQLIQPNDIVGIKTNVWRFLPTPPELETIIKRRVIDSGVPERNISINDQDILSDPIFKKATALINTRPMRVHSWSGVGTLLKNYIMFADTPSDYHDDSCANLAAIWKLPHVKGKTRLNILVMLTPLFHGVGSHDYSPEYLWPYKGLLVGTDPVAIDSIGLRIIEAKRREYFGEYRPLNPPAKHIQLADTRHHLGTADINKIELIKLGWNEGILI
ncbi:MAG: hypothetical protein A2V66_17695 [Ignavibacteria bacterium RBG_13_36_8]|nr:MAG: hypothetical protein A2V66_17695 [Ignavibacteria bacterium RBG_13_36_8]